MYVKNFAAYGERARKFLLFAYLFPSPYTPRESLRMWRIRGNKSCLHGQCTKGLLAYSPNKPRDKKEMQKSTDVNNVGARCFVAMSL